MRETGPPRLDAAHPENRGVLAYLGRGERAKVSLVALPSSVPDPTTGCGCHPDVVQRLWDELGSGLPRAARVLVHGTPALVCPRVGVVVAVGLGTSYALRLPQGAARDPAASALERVHHYRTAGVTLDLGQWGPSWRFGAYASAEPAWVVEAAGELEPSRARARPPGDGPN